MRASILARLCLSASSAAASANAVERASSTSICPCDFPMRLGSDRVGPRAASAASKRSRRARNRRSDVSVSIFSRARRSSASSARARAIAIVSARRLLASNASTAASIPSRSSSEESTS